MYAIEKASEDNLRRFPGLVYYVVNEDTGEVVRGCATIEIAMRVCKELNKTA